MFIEAEKICCSTAQRRADLAADRGQPCDFCIFFVDILQTAPHWTLEPMAQVGLLGILLLCLASIAYKVFVNKFTEVQPIGASLQGNLNFQPLRLLLYHSQAGVEGCLAGIFLCLLAFPRARLCIWEVGMG